MGLTTSPFQQQLETQNAEQSDTNTEGLAMVSQEKQKQQLEAALRNLQVDIANSWVETAKSIRI
jgi:hypothetical protein